MSYRRRGFTLIEIMVAVFIFAIIATVSYRIISSLVKTKQVVDETQNKWGNLSLVNSNLERSVSRLIPLVVRDNDGNAIPALLGQEKLTGMYDGQLEMTLSGSIGDSVLGVKPPKRVGYRLYKNSLYFITWPTLNRALKTLPEIDLLIDNVSVFKVEYLYGDGKWYTTWPPENGDISSLPDAMRVNLELNSGESIVREWSIN
ncbi:MAG: type II secretion system protein GspJ [Proteobacteria bacterium]|nr:MAG: type II secretion system protein GspJ [Pseudomonadota bacterium]